MGGGGKKSKRVGEMDGDVRRMEARVSDKKSTEGGSSGAATVVISSSTSSSTSTSTSRSKVRIS